MALLIAGIVVFAITAAAFIALLPRGGVRHRWVDTELEPYISVAICAGVGQHQRYLPRCDAVHDHRYRLDDHALHLPADRAVAAERALQIGSRP